MEDEQWISQRRQKEIQVGQQIDIIIKLFQTSKPIGNTAKALGPVHARQSLIEPAII